MDSADVFVPQIGDGLLLKVRVIHVQRIAQGLFRGGRSGDAIKQAADVAYSSRLDDGFNSSEGPGVRHCR